MTDAGLEVPGWAPRDSGAPTADDEPPEPAPTGSQRALARLRRAVDRAAAQRRAYVRLATSAPALGAPEGAVVAAFERIDLIASDAMAEIVANAVEPDRALSDHAFAHRLAARAGTAILVGPGPLVVAPDLASGVPSDPATRAGRALALQLLGVMLARGDGLAADAIVVGALTPWLTEEPSPGARAIAEVASGVPSSTATRSGSSSRRPATERVGPVAVRRGGGRRARRQRRAGPAVGSGSAPTDRSSAIRAARAASMVSADVAGATRAGPLTGVALDHARGMIAAAVETLERLGRRGLANGRRRSAEPGAIEVGGVRCRDRADRIVRSVRRRRSGGASDHQIATAARRERPAANGPIAPLERLEPQRIRIGRLEFLRQPRRELEIDVGRQPDQEIARRCHEEGRPGPNRRSISTGSRTVVDAQPSRDWNTTTGTSATGSRSRSRSSASRARRARLSRARAASPARSTGQCARCAVEIRMKAGPASTPKPTVTPGRQYGQGGRVHRVAGRAAPARRRAGSPMRRRPRRSRARRAAEGRSRNRRSSRIQAAPCSTRGLPRGRSPRSGPVLGHVSAGCPTTLHRHVSGAYPPLTAGRTWTTAAARQRRAEIARLAVDEHVDVRPEPRPRLDQPVAQARHGPVERLDHRRRPSRPRPRACAQCPGTAR